MAAYYYGVQFFKGTSAYNSANYISSTSVKETSPSGSRSMTLANIQNAVSSSMPSGYTWNNSASPVAKENCTISGAYVTITNSGYDNRATIAFFVKENSTPTTWIVKAGVTNDSYGYSAKVNGGSSDSVSNGDSAQWVATKTQNDAEFVGWYANINGTGTNYGSSTSLYVESVTSNLSYYAKGKQSSSTYNHYYAITVYLDGTWRAATAVRNLQTNVSGAASMTIAEAKTIAKNYAGANGVSIQNDIDDWDYSSTTVASNGSLSGSTIILNANTTSSNYTWIKLYYNTKTVTYILKAGIATDSYGISNASVSPASVSEGGSATWSCTVASTAKFVGWYTDRAHTNRVANYTPYTDDNITSTLTLYAYGTEKISYSANMTVSTSYVSGTIGTVEVKVSNISAGAGNWSIWVGTTQYVYNVTDSTYHFNLPYLYDGNTSSYYIIYLKDPSGETCITKVLYHLDKPTYNLLAKKGNVGTSGIYSVSVSPTTVVHGGTATWSCTLNSGYEFKGWYSDSACTNMVSNSTPYVEENITESIILYAAAYKLSYTFYAEPYSGHDNYFSSITVNGGTSATVNVGDSVTWKCNLYTNAGYTFDGWYNGSGTRVSTSLEYTTTVTNSQAFFTLYAKANVYNYTITYRDLEHGLLRYQDTPSSAEDPFYYRLWSCPSDWKLQMTEYNFEGWKEESTSIEYEENEQIQLNSTNRSRTFNAIWSKKEEQQTFTITYIYNNTEEGAPTPSPIRVKDTTSAVTSGQSSVQYRLLPISDSRFSTWTDEKFTFEGWRDLTTGTIYEGNSTIAISQNTSFETTWSTNSKITYTLKYNKGNISESISVPSTQTISSYSNSQQFEINPSSNDPTTVGQYKFKGWGTTLNNSITRYYKGDHITLYKNTNPIQTLYAQWEEISTSVTYKITYYSNNVSSVSNMPSPNPQIAENITADTYTFTVPNVTPTCNWQKFLGWGLTSSSTTATYSPNSIVILNRDAPELQLYAIWSNSLYFLWTTSEADDNVKIKKDQPFCITSTKWNQFNKLIKTYLDSSYKYTSVQQEWQFSHLYMNEALTTLKGLTNEPFTNFSDNKETVNSGDPAKAIYFTELKTFLNNKLKNP